MNRADRRNKQFKRDVAQKGKAMAHEVQQIKPMTIGHGHTDTHVVMVFGGTWNETLHLTLAEVEAIIRELRNSSESLRAHQAKKAN